MQDPSPAFLAVKPAFPEQQEHLKCPRCESSNTKFCYYNNYNLSQPRHFCKACRRYWTKGGTLRNVPVGGACRKTPKRPSNPKRQNPVPDPTHNHQVRRTEPSGSSPQDPGSNPDVAARSYSELLATSEGFGSLMDGLNQNGPGPKTAQLGDFTADNLDSGSGLDPVRDETSEGFGSLLDGLNPNGPGPKTAQLGDFTTGDLDSSSGLDPVRDEHGNDETESYLLQSGESSFIGFGWPDLDVYTHGTVSRVERPFWD